MKPYLMRTYPLPSDWCLYTKRGGHTVVYREKGNVKIEAELE